MMTVLGFIVGLHGVIIAALLIGLNIEVKRRRALGEQIERAQLDLIRLQQHVIQTQTLMGKMVGNAADTAVKFEAKLRSLVINSGQAESDLRKDLHLLRAEHDQLAQIVVQPKQEGESCNS